MAEQDEARRSDRGLGDLSPPERRAVALLALLIRLHGGRDGDGLFTGPERYAVLAARLRLAAERARDVRGFFDLLCRELRWGLAPMRHDAALLVLIRPAADDPDVLKALAERSHSVVMIARQLAAAERLSGRGEAPEGWPAGLVLPDLADPLDVFDQQQHQQGDTDDAPDDD